MDCSEYDYELFFRIVNKHIPTLLRKAYKNKFRFYVKGGKAIDAYIKREIGSPDWDIICNSNDRDGLHDYIVSSLSRDMPRVNLVFSTAKLFDKTAKQIGIDNCDGMYFADIFEGDVDDNDYTVIDGIPYLRYDKLLSDIEQTSRDRMELVAQQAQLANPETYDAITKHQLMDNSKIVSKLRARFEKLIKNNVEDDDAKENILDLIDEYTEYMEDKCKIVSKQTYDEYVKINSALSHSRYKLGKTLNRLQMLDKLFEEYQDEGSDEFKKALCNTCITNVKFVHDITKGKHECDEYC